MRKILISEMSKIPFQLLDICACFSSSSIQFTTEISKLKNTNKILHPLIFLIILILKELRIMTDL